MPRLGWEWMAVAADLVEEGNVPVKATLVTSGRIVRHCRHQSHHKLHDNQIESINMSNMEINKTC
jgi:hypothetical protein